MSPNSAENCIRGIHRVTGERAKLARLRRRFLERQAQRAYQDIGDAERLREAEKLACAQRSEEVTIQSFLGEGAEPNC
jgi:hypothetical protein